MEKYYIGVDLGGTNIAVGIVDKDGVIIYKKSTPTNLPQPEEVIENKIADLCREVCADKGMTLGKEIDFVGVGTPGIVNNQTGVVAFNANFGYKNWHLKEKLEANLGVTVGVENDANAAIIAEVVAGCAKGCSDAVILTLGTGVGAGVVIGGKVFSGSNQSGTEIGHMVIDAGGRPCNCGRRGCFEKYAAATALVYDTKIAMQNEPDSLLWQICPDIDKVNAKTAFDARDMGDETARKVVDTYMEYLACGIINVINIFQPQILCLGGGVSNQQESLLKPLQEYIDREDYARNLSDRTEIKIATFRNDAGIIGAALIGVK